MRKCKREHLQIKENIYIRKDGSKICKLCHKLRRKKYYNKTKQKHHKDAINWLKKYKWCKHYNNAKQRWNICL